MAQRVAVVTDSASCLTPVQAASMGVTVVPLQVILGDSSRPEGARGLDADVVAALAAIEAGEAGEDAQAKTSQPSLAEAAAAIERAAEGDVAHIVAVGLSEKLSGTLNVMRQAGQNARVPVTVVDSRTLGLGQAFAALSAAAVARQGGDAAAVAAEAERVARESFTLFTVETLVHLQRGGRISPTVAAVAGALGIKPVLGVKDGEVDVVERVRTAARARKSVIQDVAKRAAGMDNALVGLMTLPGDEDLDAQARELLREAADVPVFSARLSAVLAVHSGRRQLACVVAPVHPALLG